MRQPTVGIVGAGQLARMMLSAATALDVGVRLLAGSPDDGAARAWPDVHFGRYDDPEALRRFAQTCDVLTFDHELVPPPLVEELAGATTVRPGPQALLAAQDKLHQRALFSGWGLPVPTFTGVETVGAAEAFAAQTGWPVVLKAPRGGYDGRGVAVARTADELPAAWAMIGASGQLLVEEHLALTREVAVLLARNASGQTAVWPVVDTVQCAGILTELTAPAQFDAAEADRAVAIACHIAEALQVTGVMAVELFIVGHDLYVNEIALRPHNSGHWTIEGSVTSQFEQHLRAVLDWPLGSTRPTAPAVATVNVLGPADGSDPRARLSRALAVEGAHVHLYGKSARPGRKLGHVTVCSTTAASAIDRARKAVSILEGSP